LSALVLRVTHLGIVSLFGQQGHCLLSLSCTKSEGSRRVAFGLAVRLKLIYDLIHKGISNELRKSLVKQNWEMNCH